LQNMNYSVCKGQVILPGKVPVLSVGDVWTYTASIPTLPFTTGSSYTITAITLFTSPQTISGGGVTILTGPDVVTLSGVNQVSVDQLITWFTRTYAASPIGPYGEQIPAHV